MIIHSYFIFIAADSKTYHRIAETKTIISNRPVITSKPSADDSVLTVHDAQLSELGFVSPQFYDAFVLFADEDIDFATELIERMEAFGFKVLFNLCTNIIRNLFN